MLKPNLNHGLYSGCPLCNSLINLAQLCPTCHRALVDGGRVEDYLSPYAPYEEAGKNGADPTMQTELAENWNCTHLIYCPSCGQDWRVDIS
ncbi:MAG: hypothetical protein GX295_06260 [Syntrophomonadaceae bacterium]|nr:hypothetical protein [Syntrophomonadaceae bacterium]